MPSGNTSLVSYSTTVINREFRIIPTGYEIPYVVNERVSSLSPTTSLPPVSEQPPESFVFNPLELDTGSEISVTNLNFVDSLGVTNDSTDWVDESAQSYVSSVNSFGNGPVTRIDRR